ncbi:MAG: hypothetical protein KDI56_00335 [Xanthomonadales bacterium]|nr:hypothetical protein [Xanthomonadales bacterium]
MKRLLLILLLPVVVIGLMRWLADPRDTALPFGTDDLSSVQAELAELTAEERQLVEDYVRRSRGDVLPPEWADPDEPLTARTFAQAIDLERNYRVRQAEQQVRSEARADARDAAWATLRAIAKVELVRAEVLSAEALAARRGELASNVRSQSGHPVFMVRVRVQNISDETIESLQGSLKARDSEAFLPLDLCWVDRRSSLRSGAVEEFDCAQLNQSASAQATAFAKPTPGRFEVRWEPSRIVLGSGRELRGP